MTSLVRVTLSRSGDAPSRLGVLVIAICVDMPDVSKSRRRAIAGYGLSRTPTVIPSIISRLAGLMGDALLSIASERAESVP